MRPIKFRVWDKRVNKMRYDFDIQKHIEDKNTKAYIPAGVNRNSVAMKYLSQYTGVDDSNGKEIYEGDIVKAGSGHLFVIVYNQPMAQFQLAWVKEQRKLWHFTQEYDFCGSPYTVVGNIYENPELLEKD